MLNPINLLKKHACPRCKSSRIIRVVAVMSWAWKCQDCGELFSEKEMK